jgi:hypothetical protein
LLSGGCGRRSTTVRTPTCCEAKCLAAANASPIDRRNA